jgi:hypothetical protein
MASSQRSAATVLLAIAGFLPGCFLASGAFESEGTGVSAGGSGAGGGAGGSGGTGASTGGTGTTTSTPPECTMDAGCPDPPSSCMDRGCDQVMGLCTGTPVNEGNACPDPPTMPGQCEQALCVMGACLVVPLPTGTVLVEPPNGDCLQSVCDGAGGVVPMADDGDVPLDAPACKTAVCNNGSPDTAPAGDGGSCTAGLESGTCCKGDCCGDFSSTCLDSGCCPNAFECDGQCCNLGEVCCGATCCLVGTCCNGQCCGLFQTCVQGNCVP